jgi:phytol kinase
MLASPTWSVFGQRRSLVGTAAMGLSSLLVLSLLAALVEGPAPGAAAIALIAVVVTALEQCAFLGVDNLTVPMATAGLWIVLSHGQRL